MHSKSRRSDCRHFVTFDYGEREALGLLFDFDEPLVSGYRSDTALGDAVVGRCSEPDEGD